MKKTILLISVVTILMSCGNRRTEGSAPDYNTVSPENITNSDTSTSNKSSKSSGNSISLEDISTSDETDLDNKNLDDPHKLRFTIYMQSFSNVDYMLPFKELVTEVNFNFDSSFVKFEDKNESGETIKTSSFPISTSEIKETRDGIECRVIISPTNKTQITIYKVPKGVYNIAVISEKLHKTNLWIAKMGRYNKEDADFINAYCKEYGDVVLEPINESLRNFYNSHDTY